MGTVLAPTVFIDLEGAARQRRVADPVGAIGHALEASLGPDEEAAVATITASDLSHGAIGPRRKPVPGVRPLSKRCSRPFPCCPSTCWLPAPMLACGPPWPSRAQLSAHDRLVAATAMSAS